MNQLIKTKVADILLRHPETQDNDRELIVRYWKGEISELQDIAREKLQSMPYFTLDGFLATFMTGGLQALIQSQGQGGKCKSNIHNLGVKNTRNAKRGKRR
jgi:hypothetical protein